MNTYHLTCKQFSEQSQKALKTKRTGLLILRLKITKPIWGKRV